MTWVNIVVLVVTSVVTCTVLCWFDRRRERREWDRRSRAAIAVIDFTVGRAELDARLTMLQLRHQLLQDRRRKRADLDTLKTLARTTMPEILMPSMRKCQWMTNTQMCSRLIDDPVHRRIGFDWHPFTWADGGVE